jgi:hypothetical protein
VPAVTERPIHGDAHLGNVLGSRLWGDWEDANGERGRLNDTLSARNRHSADTNGVLAPGPSVSETARPAPRARPRAASPGCQARLM